MIPKNMGFAPWKAEPDIWIRKCGKRYDFRTDLVAAYVDDLAFSVEDHKYFIDKLKVQVQRHRCYQILLGTW